MIEINKLTDSQLKEAINDLDMGIGLALLELFQLHEEQSELISEEKSRSRHINSIMRLCHTGE